MKRLKIWTLKWLSTFFVCFSLFVANLSWGQNQNLPLNHQFHHDFERKSLQSDTIVHSSFKPILQRKANVAVPQRTTLYTPLNMKRKNKRSWVARKLFFEHLIFLDTNNIQLSIDPILNLELGEELRDEPRADLGNYYKNTRGFMARLNIGEKLSVATSFRENQAVLPDYLSQRTAITKVAYGQGRVKTFGDYGYDFAMASANISYSPVKMLNLQIGHGKHFVGEGFRSLLLSDLAFNYPYFRIQTDWLEGKLNYQNLFTLFQDLNRLENSGLNEGVFARKQGAFHYLNFSPNSNFSFVVFEGLVYPSLDSSGNIKVPTSYYLPVIGLNSILNGNKNEGNSVLGANVKWELFHKLKLYGQLSFADEKISEYAYQLGGKMFLGEGWTIQLEYNQSEQSENLIYSHYNSSITHPIIGSYHEILSGLYFHHDRWMSRVMYNYLSLSTYTVNYLDFRQSYLINPSYNFTVNAGILYRKSTIEELQSGAIGISPRQEPVFGDNGFNFASNSNSLYLYLSISTNLQNLYFNY